MAMAIEDGHFGDVSKGHKATIVHVNPDRDKRHQSYDDSHYPPYSIFNQLTKFDHLSFSFQVLIVATMFGSNGVPGKKGTYHQVSLDEFSDDDDDSDHDDLTPPSRHNTTSRHGNTTTTTNNTNNNNNDNSNGYAANSLGRQQELLRQQDAGLEMLSQSAERLGTLSLQIGDEIGQQNKMLDEMESDLERADEDLDILTRQTKKFIELSGGTKNCVIIAVLATVVVVLLILLIYF